MWFSSCILPRDTGKTIKREICGRIKLKFNKNIIYWRKRCENEGERSENRIVLRLGVVNYGSGNIKPKFDDLLSGGAIKKSRAELRKFSATFTMHSRKKWNYRKQIWIFPQKIPVASSDSRLISHHTFSYLFFQFHNSYYMYTSIAGKMLKKAVKKPPNLTMANLVLFITLSFNMFIHVLLLYYCY